MRMPLQKWLNGSIYRLFSMSLSNIEGPRQRVSWAGYEVEDFFTLSYGPIEMVRVPLSHAVLLCIVCSSAHADNENGVFYPLQTISLQIYSYAGMVRVGFASLKYFVEKPQLLGKCIHDTYMQLQEEHK